MKKEHKEIKNKFHIFEIKIEKNYFPKRKGNKSKSYSNKIVVDLVKLHDLEIKMNILSENNLTYKKIFDKRSKQKRPISFSSRRSLFENIENFDLEYEVFSMRLYNYRETLRNFISEFLDIKAFNIKDFLEDSKIRELQLNKDFEKFNKGDIKDLINFRKDITHKHIDLEKPISNLKEKLDIQKNRSNKVTSCVVSLLKIQDSISKKLSNIKNKQPSD